MRGIARAFLWADKGKFMTDLQDYLKTAETKVIGQMDLAYLQQVALERCIEYFAKRDGLDWRALSICLQCHAICFGELEKFATTGERPDRPDWSKL